MFTTDLTIGQGVVGRSCYREAVCSPRPQLATHLGQGGYDDDDDDDDDVDFLESLITGFWKSLIHYHLICEQPALSFFWPRRTFIFLCAI